MAKRRLVPSDWFWMICRITCCANSTEPALCSKHEPCFTPTYASSASLAFYNLAAASLHQLALVTLTESFGWRAEQQSLARAWQVGPSMAMPIASQDEAFADVLKDRISSSRSLLVAVWWSMALSPKAP